MIVRNTETHGTTHVIALIAHDLPGDCTAVTSYHPDTNEYVERHLPLTIGMGEAEAEAFLLTEPDMAEVADEAAEAVATLLRLVPDESVPDVLAAVPAWREGRAYLAGDVVSHGEGVWRCLQAHDSQGEWAPGQAPSLWAAVIRPQGDEIAEWQQPDSTNPYMRGDTVTHGGQVWESLVDNNVWRPGDPGTEALWQLVE